MGVKKIARPLNSAKNEFVKWLKVNGAEKVDCYEGEPVAQGWDYYRSVSGFIGDSLFVAYFQMWKGTLSIDYTEGENRYHNMPIEEFLKLLK